MSPWTIILYRMTLWNILEVQRHVRGPNSFSYKSSVLARFLCEVNNIALHIDFPTFHRFKANFDGLIDMQNSSTLHRRGVFPFMRLPLEVRRNVYTFALISIPLIELRINYHGGGKSVSSVPGRVRLYTDQDFRMLATSHEFREEISNALYDKNAFDISLCREDAGQGISLHQIDLRRIKNCRLSLHNMETSNYHPHMDVWGGSFPFYWHHHIRALVATLVFDGHQLQTMLVECESQNSKWLLECLRPMAMLRHVGLTHFRSDSPEIYPYLRFLEAVMMSNQDVPFRTQEGFRAQTQPKYQEPTWHRRSTDMTGELIERSLEELEAARKNMYAILNI